mgnify:FL=1
MMHLWKFVSLAGVVCLSLTVFVAPAAAQRYQRYVGQRLDRQEDWIRQGVHTGALTSQEARKLSRKQNRLEREAARLQADGRLTPQERYRLAHRMYQVDRHIYRESHDRQGTSPWFRHPQDLRWDGRRNGPGSFYRHHPRPRVQMQPYHGESHRPVRLGPPEPRLARQYW